MAKIDDVHHDDINSLNFSKKDPQRFIAGSDDGIVCTYDLTQKSVDDAADNLINVEESIKYINFLNNDIEKAYCMLGSHDLVECDLTTDNYKRIYSAGSETEELFFNVFENKDGEAFFAHNRPGQTDLIELKKISGQPIALVETQGAGLLRSVNAFKNTVIGISDEKHLAIFLENGTRKWNEKSAESNTVQGMMQEEVDEDESDITPGSRGMKSKMHSKK